MYRSGLSYRVQPKNGVSVRKDVRYRTVWSWTPPRTRAARGIPPAGRAPTPDGQPPMPSSVSWLLGPAAYADVADLPDGAATAPRPDLVALTRELVRAAVSSGISPDSPQADPVVETLTAGCARAVGRPNDVQLRDWLLHRLEAANDPRRDRYVNLLAVINGWPAPEPLVPVIDRSVQALRSRSARWHGHRTGADPARTRVLGCARECQPGAQPSEAAEPGEGAFDHRLAGARPCAVPGTATGEGGHDASVAYLVAVDVVVVAAVGEPWGRLAAGTADTAADRRDRVEQAQQAQQAQQLGDGVALPADQQDRTGSRAGCAGCRQQDLNLLTGASGASPSGTAPSG
jgi:hypothetical protein